MGSVVRLLDVTGCLNLVCQVLVRDKRREGFKIQLVVRESN